MLSCDWRLACLGLCVRAPFVLALAHHSGGIVARYAGCAARARDHEKMIRRDRRGLQ